MEILWGVWAESITQDDDCRVTITRIYEDVWLEVSDYPLINGFTVVLQCRAGVGEYEQSIQVNFKLIDIDGSLIAQNSETFEVPDYLDNTYVTWFEAFEMHNVIIDEPGTYTLSILIGNQEQYQIPLNVLTPLITDM